MTRKQVRMMSRSGVLNPSMTKPTWTGRLGTFAHGVAMVFVGAVCYLAHQQGLLPTLLFILLLPGSLATVGLRIWAGYRKTLEWGLVQRPWNREIRWYALQCLNRWACLVLIGISWHVAIIPILFSPGAYRGVQALVWGCTGLWMILALIPPKRIRLSSNLLVTVGTVFLGIELLRLLQSATPATSVVLDAPFRGEWYVFQGGHSGLTNHHYPTHAQRYALDLVTTRDGKYFQGDPSHLKSYFAFGQTLYAPAEGRVVKAVDGHPDLPIGQTDAAQPAGNYVVIDIGQGQFVTLAHLRQGSVLVSEGGIVKRGQALAQCGNSGNTTAPHLHFQVQTHADFYHPQQQAIPFVLQHVTRVRGEYVESLAAADVRRNDRVVTAGQ